MKDILNAIEKAAGLPVSALYSNELKEQIIYSIIPLSDDGIKRTDRLELNIIGFTLERVENADNAIRKALLSIGDLKKNGCLDIYINGGGVLPDAAAVHKFVNYIVVMEENLNG